MEDNNIKVVVIDDNGSISAGGEENITRRTISEPSGISLSSSPLESVSSSLQRSNSSHASPSTSPSSNSIEQQQQQQTVIPTTTDTPLSPFANSPVNTSPSIQPKKKTIDDFIIGRVLGEGSYGAVVHGTDKENNNQYAIKILEKKHIIKENKIKYVQIEKEILCKANHPNICKLFFTFRSEACLYYVLELCSQGDLLHQIKPVGSFSDECTRFYVAEIISALEHLHSLGIVHRDLKPENILLASDMHIKVTDFGTGKILPNETVVAPSRNLNESNESNGTNNNTTTTTLPRSNSFVGTAEYVSPELISNKETSTDSDLWALGCIIYQLSTGRLPFRGKTEFLTFQKVSNRELIYPTNLNPLIKDLIEKLLVIKPSDRLGSRSGGAGNDSFLPLKQHPFFAGFDWDTLHKQTPPKIVSPPERIIFEETLTDSLNSSTSNMSALLSNTPSSPSAPSSPAHTLSSESLKMVGERAKWAQFLKDNENIVESGLVWKKKGFSIKKRQLLLTTQPRLIYIDPKKMELKGEIPWSSSLKPEAKNNSSFIIQTPKRKYLLEDVEHNSQKWIDAITNSLNKL